MSPQEKEIIENTTPDNEAEVFYADPKSASEDLQKKYIWCTYSDFKRYESFVGDIPDWYTLVEKEYVDPFENEKYKVKELQKVQEITVEEMQKEIDERIAYLKYRVVQKKATTAEKEELKLLTL